MKRCSLPTLCGVILLSIPVAVQAQSKSGYNSLAAIISEPVFNAKSINQASKSYKDAAIMARKEFQRQRLAKLKRLSGSTESARNKISTDVGRCYSSLREIRRLDSTTPDYEGLVMKSLNATPSLLKNEENRTGSDNQAIDELAGKILWEVGAALVNSYNLSVERDNYKARYRASRFTTNDEMTRLVASRYTGTSRKSNKVSIATIYPSIAGTYINDTIAVRNDSGENLEACTFLIRLNGINAASGGSEADRHFHFVSYWPKGTTRYFFYPSRTFSGIGGNASVDVIRKVDVYFYSDQFYTTSSYSFTSQKYDAHVKKWAAENLPGKHFTGRWRSAADNLIDPAGFEVTYKGKLSSFTVDKVTIEAVNGTQSIRIYNGEKKWKSSQMKWICHDNFNKISPKKVNVIISFPGSSYQHTFTWNL